MISFNFVPGDKFFEIGSFMSWTVLDSDHESQTVLGISDLGEARILFFSQIEVTKH